MKTTGASRSQRVSIPDVSLRSTTSGTHRNTIWLRRETLDQRPLTVVERDDARVLERALRLRRRRDDRVDARVGERPGEERLRPGLDAERLRILVGQPNAAAPVLAGAAERAHRDHRHAELGRER